MKKIILFAWYLAAILLYINSSFGLLNSKNINKPRILPSKEMENNAIRSIIPSVVDGKQSENNGNKFNAKIAINPQELRHWTIDIKKAKTIASTGEGQVLHSRIKRTWSERTTSENNEEAKEGELFREGRYCRKNCWGQWGTWSVCNKKCHGTQYRRRKLEKICPGGCSGARSQTIKCNSLSWNGTGIDDGCSKKDESLVVEVSGSAGGFVGFCFTICILYYCCCRREVVYVH